MRIVIVILFFCFKIFSQNLSAGLQGGIFKSSTFSNESGFFRLMGCNVNFNYKYFSSEISFNYISVTSHGSLREACPNIGICIPLKQETFYLRGGPIFIYNYDPGFGYGPGFEGANYFCIKGGVEFKLTDKSPLLLRIFYETNDIKVYYPPKSEGWDRCHKLSVGINYNFEKKGKKEKEQTAQ